MICWRDSGSPLCCSRFFSSACSRRGSVSFSPASVNCRVTRVEAQRAAREPRMLDAPRAPHERHEASLELGQRERLGEEVVGALVQRARRAR